MILAWTNYLFDGHQMAPFYYFFFTNLLRFYYKEPFLLPLLNHLLIYLYQHELMDSYSTGSIRSCHHVLWNSNGPQPGQQTFLQMGSTNMSLSSRHTSLPSGTGSSSLILHIRSPSLASAVSPKGCGSFSRQWYLNRIWVLGKVGGFLPSPCFPSSFLLHSELPGCDFCLLQEFFLVY